MPQTIADTVKALTEFEAELDKVKAASMEAKKKLLKDAGEWADAARSNATEEAQRIASQRISEARKEAEEEAAEIRKKGQIATKKFAESIAKNKKAASELVVQRLLGEKE
jgi:vacuolar-type H+-ATPase subunit H